MIKSYAYGVHQDGKFTRLGSIQLELTEADISDKESLLHLHPDMYMLVRKESRQSILNMMDVIEEDV